MAPKSITVHDATTDQRYRMLMEGDLRHLPMSKVKRYLSRVSGIPMETQYLSFNGFDVGEDATGGEIGLYEGAIITLHHSHSGYSDRGASRAAEAEVELQPEELESTNRPPLRQTTELPSPTLAPPSRVYYEESVDRPEHAHVAPSSRQPAVYFQADDSLHLDRHSEHFSGSSAVYREATRSRSVPHDDGSFDSRLEREMSPVQKAVPSFRVSLNSSSLAAPVRAENTGMNVSRRTSELKDARSSLAHEGVDHQTQPHGSIQQATSTTASGFQDLLDRSVSAVSRQHSYSVSSGPITAAGTHTTNPLIVSPEQREKVAKMRALHQTTRGNDGASISPVTPSPHGQHAHNAERERQALDAERRALAAEQKQLRNEKDEIERQTRELLEDQDAFNKQWSDMKRVLEIKNDETLQLRGQLASLQAEKENMTLKVESLSRSVGEAERRALQAAERAKGTVDVATEKYIQRLKDELEREKQDNERERQLATKQFDSEIARLEETHKRALSKLRTNHSKDVEDLMKQQEEACAELEAQLKKEKRRRGASGDRHEQDIVALQQEVKELNRTIRAERNGAARVAEQLTSQIAECGRLQTLLDIGKARERELEAQLQHQQNAINTSLGTPRGGHSDRSKGAVASSDIYSPGGISVSSAHAPTSVNTVEASLRHFSHELRIPPLRLGDNHTCVVHLDDENLSAFITFDPTTKRLFLYATLLNHIPHDAGVRLQLYEELLEGSLLGREMAGGGVGISRKNSLVLISVTVDISAATEYALASIARPFLESVRRWQRIVEGVLAGTGLRTQSGYASVSHSPDGRRNVNALPLRRSHREIYSPPPPPPLPDTGSPAPAMIQASDNQGQPSPPNRRNISPDTFSSIPPFRKRTSQSVDLDASLSPRHALSSSPSVVASHPTIFTSFPPSPEQNYISGMPRRRQIAAAESVSPRPSHASEAPRPTSMAPTPHTGTSTSRRTSVVSTSSRTECF